MRHRDRLALTLEHLANQYRPHCPFATAVLESLAGAIVTDCDRELSRHVLDFMVDRLKDFEADAESAFAEIVRWNCPPQETQECQASTPYAT